MFISLKYTEGGDRIAFARAINRLSRLYAGAFLLSLGDRRVILDDSGSYPDIEQRVRHIMTCAGCTITGRAVL